MARKHTDRLQYAGAVIIAPVYLLFLGISSLFALIYSLFRAGVARRVPVGNDAEDLKTPGRGWMVALDGAIAVGAYLVADVLRCTFWQQTRWPEHLEGYGSTLGVHLLTMAVVPFAWPLLLAWIGWYRPVERSIRWKTANTIAASLILALFMGAFALVVAREAYPRMQIVFFGATLPIATAVVRGLIDWVGRRHRHDADWPRHVGPAW